MKRKTLWSKDSYTQFCINQIEKIEKRRYNNLVSSLRKLGDFNSKIEVMTNEEQSINYVIDNNGDKFLIDIDGYYLTEYREKFLMAKKVSDNKYEVYDFFSDLKKDKVIFVNNGNQMSIDEHDHMGNAYNCIYKSNDIKYHVFFRAKDELSLDNIEIFAVNVLDTKPNTLMECVDAFKDVFDINLFDRVSFNSIKDEREVGKLEFVKSKVKELDITEEVENEEIHMYLKDGEIKIDTIRKIFMPINTANDTIKGSYDRVNKLIKK